jgi:hypothetical protein
MIIDGLPQYREHLQIHIYEEKYIKFLDMARSQAIVGVSLNTTSCRAPREFHSGISNRSMR